ncbi:methyl-accepting chemotaxis protein [Heliorestis convoluta]|uniref:Methyl-accepting chemotaxis protein n=1 Tax=Heliorestis convoluta TaxID=356322 RepID=A0A5Q2N0T1_9FIRM|nr:methyl-accepting chemotaxis protein [Heliorestis convoluta]QGG48477.1 methyl-accepting chemotaxis protein [Heliorestis convoluta]
MSIKRLFQIMYLITGILLATLMVLIFLLYQNQKDLLLSAEVRYQSYLLADELRQSSDDLTRMARTYVITGDDKYEKIYWTILDIRNGKQPRPQGYERSYWDFVAANDEYTRSDGETISLNDQMKQLGFTEEEFGYLQQAEENSNNLVKIEEMAMNAMKEMIRPEEVQLMNPGETNEEFARRIMHDQRYHIEKAKIMEPIDQFFIKLDQRTSLEVEGFTKRQQTYLQVIIVILLALLGNIILAFWQIHRKVNTPLSILYEDACRISKGDLSRVIQYKSDDEIGQLASTLNQMLQKINFISQIKEASQESLAFAEKLSTYSHKSTESINQTIIEMGNASEVTDMQANKANESMQAIEQLTIGVQRIAESASYISGESEKMATDAKNGQRTIENAMDQMTTIQESAQQTVDVIQLLQKTVAQIVEFTNTILSISSQTNLLALNAAIEAARAGEQGRGFAVVAEEIRKLADGTSQSASHIEQLIAEIQTKTAETVKMVESSKQDADHGIVMVHDVRKMFLNIVQAIQKVTEQLEDMSSTSQQMSASSEEIAASSEDISHSAKVSAERILQVLETNKNNLSGVKEISVLSNQLTVLANNLQKRVDEFSE